MIRLCNSVEWNIMYDHKLTCLSWIIYNESFWYVLDHYVVRMLMNYHQCSIMMVQLQGHIIADIQVHCNIILMYVYNIYLGISSPPQFPDGLPAGSFIIMPTAAAVLRGDRTILKALWTSQSWRRLWTRVVLWVNLAIGSRARSR